MVTGAVNYGAGLMENYSISPALHFVLPVLCPVFGSGAGGTFSGAIVTAVRTCCFISSNTFMRPCLIVTIPGL